MTQGEVRRLLAAASAPVALNMLSPLETGDVVSGLTLAVGGVGTPSATPPPAGVWPEAVGRSDAWVTAVESPTGWYVILSQDCDIVRAGSDEPTLLIAPLVVCDLATWEDLRRNGYSSRRWAFPRDKFSGLADDQGLVVDLAWTTSLLKGALWAPGVLGVRPLPGPKKREFAEWLGARSGRAPFPDDVVVKVLDPCYEVRKRLLSSFRKKSKSGSAPAECRAVAAVDRWFAHHDGRLVTFLGQVTAQSARSAQLVDPDTGQLLEADLKTGVEKLTNQVLNKMNSVDSDSGFQARFVLVDLSRMSAAEFVKFSLLMR